MQSPFPLRAYSLRLLISLLMLPFASAGVIVLVQHTIFPGTYFNDFPILFGTWLVLLLGAHALLSWIGNRRFQALDRLGWTFLQREENERVAQVFVDLERLLASGLPSRRLHARLQGLLLRRYFPFFAANVETRHHRDALRRCLILKIRADEAYHVLKAYVLDQPALTLELVDLAEMLHEFAPQDTDIIRYMTQQYLRDRQKHFRAEYFYQKSLAANDVETTQAIVDLCLRAAIARSRTDAFAGWLFLRAWADTATHAQLAKLLYRTKQRLSTVATDPVLLQELEAIVEQFDPQKTASWEAEEAQRRERQWGRKVARAAYWVQQKTLALWGEILRRRRVVYPAFAGLFLFALTYALWPDRGNQEQSESVQMVNPVQDDASARFALQVAAITNARRAQQEVERLQQAGLDAFLLKPTGRSRYYRIRLGKFATKNAALATGDSLRQQQIVRDYFVVNYQRPND